MKSLFIFFLLLASIRSFAEEGSKGSRSPHSTSAKSSTKKSGGSSGKFYVGLDYAMQTQTNYSNVNDTVTGHSYSASAGFADSAGIEIGYAKMPEGFGYLVGLNYQPTQTTNGASQNGTTLATSDFKIQTTTLLVEGIYRIDILYFPVGLVYTQATQTARTGWAGTYDGKSGVGYQGGIGLFLNDAISLEVFYRTSAVNLYATLPASNFVENYGDGTLTSMNVLLKYYF